MQCPNDGAVLTMSERSGIEIDYCPTCRGVWLDRGELDKIIERSLSQPGPAAPAPAPAAPTQQYQQPAPQQGYDRGGYQQGYGQKPYKKRKESWLSELFD
ncbi:zf-TFIIB domain-containing protein [Nocardioides sp.]|uniref:TFIIB-type zinc ribbon-containing protein n=1 Tax=Nocardioides sp. TaxID=35761 RepID=UPI001A1F2194|nr:zf-TFIIB domain-containing protein [Nocardioides sp.]MBJ7359930.1 zf-TFIIB domain-containing protein [Nocardioides sp.]